jgi:uracil phosphoribosyltransferase
MATLVDHPLIQDKLARLRDARTTTPEFKRLLHETAVLMLPAVFADMRLREESTATPMAPARVLRLADPVAAVAILRAGLGMAEALAYLPDVVTLHFGMRRDPSSLQPSWYYRENLEQVRGRVVVVADPMIATGGTLIECLTSLRPFEPRALKVMGLLAAADGVRRVEAALPEAQIYVCGVDPVLNDKGYIVPGLGDAGDRLFGLAH